MTNRAGFFAAAAGLAFSRPAYDSAIEIQDASNAEQSQAITIPADCELVVVTVGTRHNAASAGTVTATLGGSAPDYTPVPFQQNTSRSGVAIYGFLTSNTGTGSQTWSLQCSGNAGSGSHITFYFFSAGNWNPDMPFQTGQRQEDLSAGSPINITYDPVFSEPLILANCSITQSSGSGENWVNQNLTNEHTFDDSNTCYASGYNNTLTDPGSTLFEFDNTNWVGSYASMALVEMTMVGVAYAGPATYISGETDAWDSTPPTGEMTATIPSNCNLLVVYIGSRDSGGTPEVSSLTVGGNAMTAMEPFFSSGGRCGAGIYYYINPPTGSQTISVTLDEDWFSNGMVIRAEYFIGNTLQPFRRTEAITGTTAGSATFSWTIDLDDTYLIGMCVANYDTGSTVGSVTWTNLTETEMVYDYGNSYITVGMAHNSNPTLGAGSYVMDWNWGPNYSQSILIELNPLYNI